MDVAGYLDRVRYERLMKQSNFKQYMLVMAEGLLLCQLGG